MQQQFKLLLTFVSNESLSPADLEVLQYGMLSGLFKKGLGADMIAARAGRQIIATQADGAKLKIDGLLEGIIKLDAEQLDVHLVLGPLRPLITELRDWVGRGFDIGNALMEKVSMVDRFRVAACDFLLKHHSEEFLALVDGGFTNNVGNKFLEWSFASEMEWSCFQTSEDSGLATLLDPIAANSTAHVSLTETNDAVKFRVQVVSFLKDALPSVRLGSQTWSELFRCC